MKHTPGNTTSSKERLKRLCREGQYRDALALGQTLCGATPRDPELWFLQAAIHGALEDFASAERCCRRALALAPRQAMLHYNLGIALLRLKRPAEAEATFKTALDLQPAWPEALTELGHACAAQGSLEEAIRYYRQALSIAPQQAGAILGLATAHVARFEYGSAKTLLEASPALPAEGHYLLGVCHKELGELPAAALRYLEALRLSPDHAGALSGLAELHALHGNPAAGLDLLEQALAHPPAPLTAILTFSHLAHHAQREAEAIDLLEASLARELGDRNGALVHFALGRLYDRGGDHERAFEHYRQGNHLRGARFDPGAWSRHLEALMNYFRREHLVGLPRGNSDFAPVFIVGMPRSGTTLVEQIVASHPDAFGAGELPLINAFTGSLAQRLGARQPYPACLDTLDQRTLDALAREYQDALPEAARQAHCVLDKMPGNYLHLGLIALIFPGARIVHCLRDPRDNCLSCFFQHFSAGHEYAYDLAHLGAYYRAHERLMAHWREHLDLPVLTLHLEELIEDQEARTRRLLEFCGLDWDDRCLRFHESTRGISTASFDQVRRPLNRDGLGRWRQYQHHLAPLFTALSSDPSP